MSHRWIDRVRFAGTVMRAIRLRDPLEGSALSNGMVAVFEGHLIPNILTIGFSI